MKADIIIKGNKIFTGLQETPQAGFLAIKDNKIIIVEENPDVIPEYVNEQTRIYEFEDQLIMPGMCDAHFHFNLGVAFNSPLFITEIEKAESAKKCAEMIKEFSDNHPELHSIKGKGWLSENWTDTVLPTKHVLDSVVSDKPVYLISADEHTAWLNSKALELLEIPDHYEYESDFHKDSFGELTGIIGERAYVDLIYPIALAIDPENAVKDTENLINEMLSVGLTGCHDLSGIFAYEDYSALEQLERENRLNLRINHTLGFGIGSLQERKVQEEKYDSPMFQFSSLKGYVDGVRATYTALLLEPYYDKPELD